MFEYTCFQLFIIVIFIHIGAYATTQTHPKFRMWLVTYQTTIPLDSTQSNVRLNEVEVYQLFTKRLEDFRSLCGNKAKEEKLGGIN